MASLKGLLHAYNENRFLFSERSKKKDLVPGWTSTGSKVAVPNSCIKTQFPLKYQAFCDEDVGRSHDMQPLGSRIGSLAHGWLNESVRNGSVTDWPTLWSKP